MKLVDSAYPQDIIAWDSRIVNQNTHPNLSKSTANHQSGAKIQSPLKNMMLEGQSAEQW